MLSASSGVKTRRACWIRLPSWASTDDGTSVGAWVTKKTPTPLERMRRTVCSIWSRSASEASSKRRCASSKKKTSFGFGQVAGLGERLVELGQHPEHEGREELRAVHDVRELQQVDDALPVGARAQEVLHLEGRLAEEGLGALLLQGDQRAQDDPEGRGRHPAVVLEDRLALVRAEELERRAQVREVEERQVVVVAVLEDQRQDAGLGLVEVEDLAQEHRAERGDRRPDLRARASPRARGAPRGGRRARTPCPAGRRARSPSGWPRRPGSAIPVRSPFTSAMKVGTPARASCPAIPWSVLVFPVPVAPATSPCRLSMDRATWTRTPVRASTPSIGAPR